MKQECVNTEHVESVILELDEIADCKVLTRRDSAGLALIIAYIVPQGPYSEQHLRQHLEQRLSNECLPNAISPISSVPLTPEGNWDIAALEAIPIIDPSLISDIETQVQTMPGVRSAAAILQTKVSAPKPMHLAELLPNWTRHTANPHSTAQSGSVWKENISPDAPPALSDGGELLRNAEQPTTLSETLRRAAQCPAPAGMIYYQTDGSDQFFSYQDTLINAERILGGLRAAGLTPGTHVIFQLASNQDFLEAFWACVLGGFIPVPLAVAPTYGELSGPVRRLGAVCTLLDGAPILTSEDLASSLQEAGRLLDRTLPLVTLEPLRVSSPDNNWHVAQADDVALMMLTSGSTGLPKGVPLSHSNLMSRTLGSIQMHGFDASLISLNWMPLDHVAGLIYFHLRDVHLACRQIQIATNMVLSSPLLWLDLIQRYRAQVTFSPNFAIGLVNGLETELSNRHWDLSSMRLILNGAEAIVAATARRFLKLLEPHGLPQDCMCPAWGMSEISSGVTYEREFSLENTTDGDRYVKVGKPIPGVKLRIVDEDNNLLRENEVGRLQVAGATMFKGYYGKSISQEETFTPDGWFKTGDLGQLIGGSLIITGREKDIIIINGVNYPGPAIEATVEELPGVARSYTAACGVADQASGAEALAIFFSPEVEDERILSTLMQSIRQRVAQEFGISPTYLVPVEKEVIPKTSIGKIQRTQLQKGLESGEFENNLRRADILSANTNTIIPWFFRRTWHIKGRRAGDGIAAEETLLVFADGDLADACKKAIGTRSDSVVLACKGSSYERNAPDRFTVDADNAGDIRRALETLSAEGRTPTRGIYLWHWSDRAPSTSHSDDLETAIQTCAQLSTTIRGLAALTHGFSLAVVSNGLQRVREDDTVDCARAPVLGMLRPATSEHPHLRLVHIDVAGSTQTAVESALDELDVIGPDREIAYRNGQRFIPQLQPAPLSAADAAKPQLRQGGTYLISGGLGGVATEVASYLLRDLKAHLILVGRSALPSLNECDDPSLDEAIAAKCAAWKRLSSLGDVTYLRADVTNPMELNQVLSPVLAKIERLDGIFHLAGAFHERPIDAEDRDSLTTLFSAKIGGAAVLAELAQKHNAVFIAFSSVTTLFGGALVGGYAAANFYLDALAQQASDTPRYSLNWSSWHQTGLTARHGTNELAQTMGMLDLSHKQAIASLQVALHQMPGQLFIGLDGTNATVARHLAQLQTAANLYLFYVADAEARITSLPEQPTDRFGTPINITFTSLDQLPINEDGRVNRAALGRLALGDTKQIITPSTATERKLADIWRRLLVLDEVSTDWSFFALGGQSLLATQLIAAITEQFHVNWTLRDVFDAPTISAQADRLDTEAKSSIADAPPQVIAKATRDQAPPLGSAQLRMWFLDRVQPGNPAFHIPAVIRFKRAPDLELVQNCINAIVSRHEALRTSFPQINGEPRQAIAEQLFIEVTTDELTNDRSIDDYAAAEARVPFDLAKGPLLRAKLLLLADGSASLYITIHHIICDGWSMKVFFSEFLKLFQAGGTTDLAPVSLQYADFASWQKQLTGDPTLDSQLSYWREQLGSNLNGFILPTDKPRPLVQTYTGALVKDLIPAGPVQRIRDLARRRDVTVFVTMLAAYQALLSRYAQQSDVIVGTVVANRDRPEFKSLIGFMVNPVALRTDLSGDPRFVELLQRVHRTTVDAYAHHDIPFETLVDELQPQRDISRSPLFQLAFDFRDPEITRSDDSEVSFGVMEPDMGAAQYDLRLTLEEQGEGLLAIWEFNTDIFDRSTIERMSSNYQTLLNSVATHPEQRLSLLPLLSDTERRFLRNWNQTARPFASGQCLHNLFEAHVQTQPSAPAVEFGETTLSYAQLNERANQWAHHLRMQGVGPDVLVAVCLDRSIDLVVSLLAILKAGGAYLPLDPSYPSERLQFMLEDSGVKLLLSHSTLLEQLPEHTAQVMCVDREDSAINSLPTNNPDSGVTSNNLAYVIYTSGSTGRPKGVLVEHHGWCNLAQAQHDTFGLRPGMRVLQFASLSFDASAFELSMALANGGTLVMANREALIPGTGFARLLRDAAINVVTLPPSTLVALNSGDFPALEVITVAGEACPAMVVERWATPDRRFYNLYGPTEATIWASFAECRPGASAPPIGRPIANARLYVLDTAAQPVPLSMPGELYIGGEGVTRGYLNRPDLTAERFIPDPYSDRPGARLYRSGDLVRLRADGELEFLGRMDHQVKLRGFRIELGEIEELLREHATVGAAIVVAHGETGDQALVAYVSPAPSQTPDGAALRQYLGTRLPAHMIPSTVVVLDRLPLTANGKVDRAALPDPKSIAPSASGEMAAQTSLERTIASVWEEVLQVEGIDRRRNFFDAGGHSLKLAQVQTLLNTRLGRDIELTDLFKYPTISSLAAYLEAGDGAVAADSRRDTAQVASNRQRLTDMAQRQRAARHRINR